MYRSVVVLTLTLAGVCPALVSPNLERHLASARADQRLPVHVVLKRQFEPGLLSSLVAGMDRAARRVEVARLLGEFSQRQQKPLLDFLSVRADAVSDVNPLWILNAVYCRATPEVVRLLAARPEVWYVAYDLAHAPSVLEKGSAAAPADEVAWGVEKVNAPAVWALGYNGAGIICGHIDTGVNYRHPDLSDHMWTDPNYPNHGWNFEYSNNDPDDEYGHGTHTAGTVAGDGTGGSQTGVAPEAQIMALRVRTMADSVAESQCWAAMQFCVAPPLSPSHGADLYTMSLGWMIEWDPQQAAWRTTANNVNAAGLSQIVAAGNERGMVSPPYDLRCPGNVPPPWPNPENTGTGALSGVVSIGATDINDLIADFSSEGPSTWMGVAPFNDWVYPPGITDPDVSAPGVDVKSTSMSGGYEEMSGTSMATPHTAGAVCLMLSKNPNLNPREVDSLLEVTALDLGATGKDNDYGAGRIDALAAVNATRPPFGVRYLRHVVDDSAPGGNGDGIVNPGETVNVPLWVVNLCDYTTSGVGSVLRTGDPNITLSDSLRYFGTLGAGDTAFTGHPGYGFSVATACTNRYELKFDLVVTDTLDSVWVTPLTLLAGEPRLRGDSVYAFDGGNGKLDPGEDCDIAVELENYGLGNGYDVNVTLRSMDNRMVVPDSTAAYGFVPADSSVMNLSDHFHVQVSRGVPREFPIPCTLHVTQAGYPPRNLAFSIEVGRLTGIDPIPDGPRTPALYWAYDNGDSGYVEAPVFSWVEVAGIGTLLNLEDDETQTLTLPSGFGPFQYYGSRYTQVSVCSNGWIAPGATTASDYSNEALPRGSEPPMLAANWDDLYPPVGGGVWYSHDAANHRFVVEWDSVSYYPGEDWDRFEIVLYDTTLAAADGNSEFCYQYLSATRYNECTVGNQDPSYGIGMSALFDGTYHRASLPIGPGRAVKFTTDSVLTGVSEQTPGSGSDRLALAPGMNPVRGAALLRYFLPAAAEVELSVVDICGRRVKTLVNTAGRQQAPGAYVARWDGSDDAGRRVSSGVYFYWLETPLGRVSRKAVLAR